MSDLTETDAVQGRLDEWMPNAFDGSGGQFGAEVLPAAGSGFRVPAVRSATGVTYRQLDYWARTELVVPSIRVADGSGSQRLYSFGDIVAVRVIKRLLDAGVSLRNVRVAAQYLRGRGDADLGSVTLVCDGVSVYECTTDDQIVDLLAGGQGVFGIAVGNAVSDVAAAVRDFPTVTETQDAASNGVADDLAARRQARRTA